ncbi:hypothetical protein M1373_00120, partial [Candidatus Marsarchaeota archaeon]|nr:hypothetical protein [Candidatus Marsarchaeota archaeon]
MEIKFITNNRFRKLDAIFNIFGKGSLPEPVKRFPAFFGKEVYLSSRIFEASVSMPQEQYIWDVCFDDNPEKEIEKPEYAEIVSMLDNLDVHLEKENDDFFNELKGAINSTFSQKIEDIEKNIWEIFKMDLPKKLVIILDKYSIKTGSQGQKLAVNKDISVIGHRIGEIALKKDRNEPASVLLHELLHCLFSRYNVIAEMDNI